MNDYKDLTEAVRNGNVIVATRFDIDTWDTIAKVYAVQRHVSRLISDYHFSCGTRVVSCDGFSLRVTEQWP